MKTIRRSPQIESRIAKAMEDIHQNGPILVVELVDEVHRLQEQVNKLKHTTKTSPKRAQRLVEALRT